MWPFKDKTSSTYPLSPLFTFVTSRWHSSQQQIYPRFTDCINRAHWCLLHTFIYIKLFVNLFSLWLWLNTALLANQIIDILNATFNSFSYVTDIWEAIESGGGNEYPSPQKKHKQRKKVHRLYETYTNRKLYLFE